MPRNVTYKIGLQVAQLPDPSSAEGGSESIPQYTRRLTRALECAQKDKDWVSVGEVLKELGEFYEEVEDLEKTVGIARQELDVGKLLAGKKALTAEERRTALMIEARGLYRLGKCLREMEAYDRALECNKEYLACTERLKDPQETFQALLELGLTRLKRGESEDQRPGDMQSAQAAFEKARSTINSAGLPKEQANDLRAQINMNIGITYKHTGDFKRAVESFEYALRRAESADPRNYGLEADAYCNLAVCHEEMGNLEGSIKWARKELEIHQALDDYESQARVLVEIAKYKRLDDKDMQKKVANDVMEVEAAVRKESEIKALSDQLKQARTQKLGKRKEFELLGERGNLLLELMKAKEAISDFEEQKRIGRNLQMSKQLMDKVVFGLGRSYGAVKRYDDAIICYREVLNDYTGSDYERAEVLENLGEALRQTNAAYHQIVQNYEEMRGLGVKLSDPQIQCDALRQLIWAHEKHGYKGRARDCEILLRVADELIKTSSGETPESFDPELGSADPDMMTDAEVSDKENGAGTSLGAEEGEEEEEEDEGEDDEKAAESEIRRPVRRRRSPSTSPPRSPGSSSPAKKRKAAKHLTKPVECTDKRHGVRSSLRSRQPRTTISDVIEILSDDDDDADILQDPLTQLVPKPTLGPHPPALPHKAQLNKERSTSPSGSSQVAAPARPAARRRLIVVSSPDRDDSVHDPGPTPALTVPTSPERRQQPAREASECNGSVGIGGGSGPSRRATLATNPSVSNGALRPMFDMKLYWAHKLTRLLPRRRGVRESDSFAKDTFEPLPIKAHAATKIPTNHTYTQTADCKSLNSNVCTPVSIAVSAAIAYSTERKKRLELRFFDLRWSCGGDLEHTPRPLKVRVVLRNPKNEDEIFAIPCPAAGTPKTIGWLRDEAIRRFQDIYHMKPPILKLVTHDPETEETETLAPNDFVLDLLQNRQKVYAVGIE
ncbi:hypothetical protein HK104_000840 [Borealophlyctis nickersoniae]|nr:hypothetical protein HK104_000840 [Borealophlyctis nickersoniae]